MYIYDLPFDTNKELCRLLDNDDDWKELAGHYMKYSPFVIDEIEQKSHRQAVSPSNQLLIRWGQLNHKVEELFILLYRMQHMPALNCLKSHVGEKYQRLLSKKRNGVRDRSTLGVIDENGNRPPRLQPMPLEGGSESSLPLPVVLYQQDGTPTPTHSVIAMGEHSNTDRNTSSSQEDSSQGDIDSKPFCIPPSSMSVPMLGYEELKTATGDWNESNLLGRGGFGQVFKGEWKLLTVAVKRLTNNDAKNRELIREMLVNQYRHDNILPLYAYSIGGPEACLVYQLMAGGSLEERLKCKNNFPPLSWAQRHRIAHGVARGLQFLHTMMGTPLIHGDIKPANILLDQCTIPKIGDFGLARKGPYGEERTHLKVSRVHGTRPYLPDEYLRSRCLSPAVDVFSFGVVLLEGATALPAMLSVRAEPLLSLHVLAYSTGGGDLAMLEDRMIYGTQASNPHLCRQFLTIGLHCTRADRRDRPTMLEVYKILDAMNFPGRNTA